MKSISPANLFKSYLSFEFIINLRGNHKLIQIYASLSVLVRLCVFMLCSLWYSSLSNIPSVNLVFVSCPYPRIEYIVHSLNLL